MRFVPLLPQFPPPGAPKKRSPSDKGKGSMQEAGSQVKGEFPSLLMPESDHLFRLFSE
jgi:hypothetical protein